MVELGAGSVDVLVTVGAQRDERCPAEVELGDVALRIDGRRFGGFAPHQRKETPAMRSLGDGNLERLEDGRKDIDGSHGSGDALSRGKRTGALQDQGNAESGVVDEEPVAFFSVLAERLSVVRRDHDERVLAEPSRLEGLEHAAHLGIHVLDLTVVTGGIGRRRSVGKVGIEKVQPREERSVRGSLRDPGGEGAA